MIDDMMDDNADLEKGESKKTLFGSITKTADGYALKTSSRRENYFYEDPELEVVYLKRAQGHPNIIKVYDTKISVDKVYIKMEYIPMDLYEYYRKYDHRIDHNIVKCIMKDVLSALVYLQNKGIAHMDVSLENILVEKNSSKLVVKLTDFGGAQEVNPSPRILNRFVGKMHYIPPEVWEKELVEPSKVDSWSIGVCLFTLLVGCPPYDKAPTYNNAHLNFIFKHGVKQLLDRWGIFDPISNDAIDLMGQLLCKKEFRLDPKAALKHKYFDN
jgi:serine/threonine protein kinase